MSKTATQYLGEFRGRDYSLAVDVRPDWNRVEDFVATVFYRELDLETGEEEKVEVARIDNRSHGHTHFDRLFDEGNPRERFDGTVWDAWREMAENWVKYAGRHDRNKG